MKISFEAKKNIYSQMRSPLLKCSTLPLRPGIRKDCPGLPLLFIFVLKGAANTIREEKEIECFHIGKEEKIFLFTDDMTAYIEKT